MRTKPFQPPGENRKNRLSTKLYLVMVLLRYDASKPLHNCNPTLRELRDDLELDFGRKVSVGQIRRLLHQLTDEGIIEREFNAWHFAQRGNEAQATKYTVKDLCKALDLCISDKEEVIRKKAREKKTQNSLRLPDKFYMNGYKPGRTYVEGYAPFHHAITQTELGPTFPKRDPRNINKVRKANDILIMEKIKHQDPQP